MTTRFDGVSDADLQAELARRHDSIETARWRERGRQYAAQHPVVARWRVTTEGDCEGRSTRDLGVHDGHVADIAAVLAPLVDRSLTFAYEPAASVPKRRNEPVGVVVRPPDMPSDYARATDEQRAVFVEQWLGNEPTAHTAFHVGAGYMYGSVMLNLAPKRTL